MSDQQERSAPQANQHVITTFAKNWISVWRYVLGEGAIAIGCVAAAVGGSVFLALWLLVPMIAYGVYVFGMEGVATGQFSTTQWAVVAVLESVWILFNGTVASAGYKTIKGEKDD